MRWRALAMWVGLGGVVVTCLSYAYVLGKDVGAKDLEQVRTFKGNIPDLIAKLDMLSSEVVVKLELADRLAGCEDRSEDLAIKIEDLRGEIAVASQNYNDLANDNERLRRIVSVVKFDNITEFSLGSKEARVYFDGCLRVGLESTGLYSCRLKVNGKVHQMSAGDAVDLSADGVPCNVILTKMTYDSVYGQIRCE